MFPRVFPGRRSVRGPLDVWMDTVSYRIRPAREVVKGASPPSPSRFDFPSLPHPISNATPKSEASEQCPITRLEGHCTKTFVNVENKFWENGKIGELGRSDFND